MSKFIDQAIIEVRSGKGGAGCVSFRREKYVPRGGPDGGDGGRGGDVVIKVSEQRRTLLDLIGKKIFKAGNGKPGGKSNRFGADGADCIILVPQGTLVIDDDTGECIADLVARDQEIRVATGGRGGKGNAHFATATHQTPRFAQPGEPGQSFMLRLELKLIADVGLVGFPNAGKSMFISVISNAKPKIADYPFTTLTPNLGVVRRGSGREFVIADIPGIVEGSHEGKGLGDRFLRHIERTTLILLLIDVSPNAFPRPESAIPLLIRELQKYKDRLEQRVSAILATKIDTLSEDERLVKKCYLRREADKHGISYFEISSVTGENVSGVLNYIEGALAKIKNWDSEKV
ncbi:MAG: GTPase ObgE [bacterium]